MTVIATGMRRRQGEGALPVALRESVAAQWIALSAGLPEEGIEVLRDGVERSGLRRYGFERRRGRG
jgi:hypothetical protein